MKHIYVVGIGPGKPEYFTEEAMNALGDSEVIFGYTVYVDLVKPMLPEKDYRTTGMRQELERCRLALESAAEGRTTAMICSGDAGVYGMASPILEMAQDYPDVTVDIVAGVTSALSGGAVLGAPLTGDFCVISLSDILTPKEKIEARLKAAALGDFAVVLYNPSSRHRPDYLKWACDFLLEGGKSPDTVCGFVRNIGREGEEATLCTLSELREIQVDMFTTVFIGTSETKAVGNYMVTPRGYVEKEARS